MARKIILLTLLSSLLSGLIGLGCGTQGAGEADTSTGAAEGERVHGLTKAQAAELLVKVGETEITVGDFAERLADQSPYLRARYNSPERRREFLENMVRFELLAMEAERRGMHDLPEVARTRKQVMIQQLMKEEFEDRIQLADITEEEIRAYYEGHLDEFHKPEQVRASQIVTDDRRAAERLLAQILEAPSDIELFRRLAQEHNADPVTREAMGDLRFFSRPGEEDESPVPAPIAEAAFSIERIGQVHPEIIEHDGSFYIVKLTGRRAALHRSQEEAQRPIQNRLWRERRESAVEELVAQLRRDANVEINADALSEVQIELPAGPAPIAPPGANAPSSPR